MRWLALAGLLVLTGCPSAPSQPAPVIQPPPPPIVYVPVIPQFDLDLTPCQKPGGGALDTDLDLAIKGARAAVRADCNANKLDAAKAALARAIADPKPPAL